MLTAAHLHGYQRRASRWAQDRPGAALWCEMGTGKTAATIDAVGALFDRWDAGRVLVIAPKRVAQRTWPAELGTWEQLAGVPFTVLGGVASKVGGHITRMAREDAAPIHIIGRDNVSHLVGTALKGRKWPYDTVVIDEATSFKASSSARFRALRRARPHMRRVIELTGSPAPNGYEDLWAQIYLLDEGERLGRHVTGFRERWFVQDYGGFGWRPREGAEEEIDARLADICMSLRAADYLDLPPRTNITVPVDLPLRARAQYRELEREFLVELGEGGTIAAFSAAALSNKLRQFCNGAVYVDEGGRWSAVHDGKLDALAEIVDGASGPVLCGYAFRSDVARIKARFPFARAVDEPGALDAWERGALPMLLAHPASAGHGLNLQGGGSTAVWFGLPWSLEEYQQFNARLHRQGQTRPVFIHHIVVDRSLDETLVTRLGEKHTTQASLLDAVRSDMEGRR